MPLLSFQVQADYDKVIRLRSEIEKLKSEMKSVNAVFDADRFNSYNKRLKEATTEFNALVDSAAKAGAKVNSSVQAMSRTVDLSNPTKELKKFDGQVDELCKHLNAYFDFLKGKLQDTLNMLNEVGSIADKVNVDDKNVGHIEELKRQNAELTSEIQRQIAAYEEQQSRFQALSDAIRTNNVPALQQLAEQEDEASKRLKLDEARNSLKGVTDDMKSLAAQMAETQGDVERLESLLDSLKNSHLDDGNAIKDIQYLETEQALESAREKLVGMKKEYNEMAILQKQYSDQVQQTSGHQERLRTQIMNAREDMVKLIAAGQAGTPTFNEIVSQTGKMRRELALANAYMQYFADPNRNLATLKQSMEGAAGGASLLVGVMGLFNQKSEEMEMIQTKLQSLLGIIVGLETTYAAVKKTSNVMIAIGQIQSWASAKAKAAETVATEAGTVATIKATAAQAMFNTVAKANPYLALLSIIGLVVGGIYTLAKALGSETDEQKKAAEAAKEHAEEIRKQHEAWAHSVANNAAKQIMSYKNLQKKWEELGNDLKAKEKFVTDNKTAFNDLGFSVDNVTQAENLLIKNTDAVVNAIMARAKAAAYEKVATEELERQIRIELEKGTVANGAYRKNFKKGQRLSLDEARELERESGVSLVGANSKSTKGVAFATDVEVTNENVLNNAAKKAAENRRKRYLADRTKRIQESKDKVKLIQENARQEYEAEKAAVEQTGVPQFTPTKTTSRNGGNTSDRLHAIMDKQKLDEQRRAIDLEFSTREAQIKAMQDGTDRVLAQIELDRDREEEAIRRSYEDMRLKRIEEARKVWEADPKNKGKNFYDTQEYAQANTNTQEETDNRDARMKAAKADYKKALEEQRDMQVQSLRDYLKEYGSIQDQKRAIAEEYDRKIAKATDEIQKQALEKQKQAQLETLNMEEFKSSINWEQVFGDLSLYSTQALEALKQKLRKALDMKDITPENAKVLTEKILEIENRISEKSNVWSSLIPGLKERNRLINEAKLAEEEYRKAVEKLAESYNKVNKAQKDAAEKIKQVGLKKEDGTEYTQQDIANMSETAINDLISKLELIGVAGIEAADSLKDLKVSTVELDKTNEDVSKKRKSSSDLNSLLTGSTILGDFFKSASGGGGTMNYVQMGLKNGESLKELVNTIGLHDTEFGEAVEDFSDGCAGFQQAISALQNGDIVGAVTGVIKGFQGWGGAIEKAFGFSFSGSNAEEVRAKDEELVKANEQLRISIDALREEMSESSGAKAIDKAIEAIRQQEIYNNNVMERWKNDMGYHGSHHSNAYTWDLEDSTQQQVNAALAQYAKEKGIDAKSINVDNWEEFMNLTPEEMDYIRKHAQAAWADITSEGSYEWVHDALNEYADLAGVIEEMTAELYENLTQTTSQGVSDNFLNDLYSLADGVDDVSENIEKRWQEMVNKMVVKNLIGSAMQDDLDKWYKKLAELQKKATQAKKDGTFNEAEYLAEMNELKAEYNKMVSDSQQQIEELRAAGIINSTEDVQQKATFNSAKNITYEQADALVGIETAQQIAMEQGNTKKDAILSQATMMNVTMSDIRSIAVMQHEIADDTRTILANSYLELRDINEHQDKIEKAVVVIQSDVEEMKEDIKDLK